MKEVALTTTHEKELGAQDDYQLVTFLLSNEVYGIEILAVQEIIRMQSITIIPQTLAYVCGIINLRGQVIPVIDLRARFNLPPKEVTNDTRIIVFEVNHYVMGMIVDGVSQVIRMKSNLIDPPSPLVANSDSTYIKGVGKLDKTLLTLLDLTKITDQIPVLVA